jgi:hypothetical protein
MKKIYDYAKDKESIKELAIRAIFKDLLEAEWKKRIKSDKPFNPNNNPEDNEKWKELSETAEQKAENLAYSDQIELAVRQKADDILNLKFTGDHEKQVEEIAAVFPFVDKKIISKAIAKLYERESGHAITLGKASKKLKQKFSLTPKEIQILKENDLDPR